jgi:cysteine synthase A
LRDIAEHSKESVKSEYIRFAHSAYTAHSIAVGNLIGIATWFVQMSDAPVRALMTKFASILETVGHTPVIRINKLAPKGISLFVKSEAFNPLGSVKDRLALGVIEAAEKSGELKPGQTVIEATSGNTGIGLAMVCAVKGYPLVVTMAETFSSERRKLMRFLGAKVVLTPAADRAVGMVNKAIELAKTHGWFLTRQFENEANPDMHSRTTAREIIDDFAEERLDYWVTGFGTGGTLKGVARVLAKERPETKIIVCEPSDAPMLSNGAKQERNLDGSPTKPNPAFKPHPMQGWSPDFIPKITDERCCHGPNQSNCHHNVFRRDGMQPRPRTERRHLRRHYGGRNFCWCARNLQKRIAGRLCALHAPRHR